MEITVGLSPPQVTICLSSIWLMLCQRKLALEDVDVLNCHFILLPRQEDLLESTRGGL